MMRRLLTIRIFSPGPVATCLGRWASAYGLAPTGLVLTTEACAILLPVDALSDLAPGIVSFRRDWGEVPSAFGGSAVGATRCSAPTCGVLGGSDRREGALLDGAASFPSGGRAGGG